MDNKTFKSLIQEALTASSRDEFISSLGWQDWMDEPEFNGDPAKIAAALDDIYLAAHRSVREIIDEVGMTLRAFSDRFCIPYKTVQNWCSSTGERRECPFYIRLMVQECLGLINIEVGDGATTG